jgi:hypothetical protein
LIDIPANLPGVLTTLPLYRTTYVLAYRSDKGIAPFKSLDDPRLKTLRVGVMRRRGCAKPSRIMA